MQCRAGRGLFVDMTSFSCPGARGKYECSTTFMLLESGGLPSRIPSCGIPSLRRPATRKGPLARASGWDGRVKTVQRYGTVTYGAAPSCIVDRPCDTTYSCTSTLQQWGIAARPFASSEEPSLCRPEIVAAADSVISVEASSRSALIMQCGRSGR